MDNPGDRAHGARGVAIVRPGPSSIEPNGNPGGLVVHIYQAVERGELLRVSSVGPGMDQAEAMAREDMDVVVRDPRALVGICLVVYDGDTGERWGAVDYMAAHLVPDIAPEGVRAMAAIITRDPKCESGQVKLQNEKEK